MGINILVSGFVGGFPPRVGAALRARIPQKSTLAFVASDFEAHDKTDRYARQFAGMFGAAGIELGDLSVVDSRMTAQAARRAVAGAGVLWLAGGDTLAQFAYLEAYGLPAVIRARDGVTMGMSAGAINMAKTAVCTADCGHEQQSIYPALGLVDISVEPHFDPRHVSDALRLLSHTYPLYGLCDEAAIIQEAGGLTCIGAVYRIDKGRIERIR